MFAECDAEAARIRTNGRPPFNARRPPGKLGVNGPVQHNNHRITEHGRAPVPAAPEEDAMFDWLQKTINPVPFTLGEHP